VAETLSQTAPPVSSCSPAEAGLACAGCGATKFKTTWQTFKNGTKHVRMECAICGRFQRYLPQKKDDQPGFEHQPAQSDLHAKEMAPIPARWDWIGYVRGTDKVWQPVALCKDLASCWDALLTTHQRGDLLCIPVMPVVRDKEVSAP
jgi:hypothetical protein